MLSPRRMMTIATCAVLACAIGASTAVAESGFIWSGTTTKWGYNHRINRIGGYVDPAGCDAAGRCRASLVQTGASGVGTDIANTSSSAWIATAEGVSFRTTSATLRIKGARGEQITATGTAALKVPRGSRVVALLNGYDLLSNTDASKFGAIRFGVGDATVDRRGRVQVPVSAVTQLLCSSPECVPGAAVDYTLTIRVVVIAARPNLVRETRQSFQRSLSWPDGPDSLTFFIDPDHGPYGGELKAPPETKEIRGQGGSAGLVGIRSLTLQLPKQLHALALNTAVTSRGYQDGTASFDLDLLFKNWSYYMNGSLSPFSWFAYPEAGSAELSADLSLVEFTGSASVRQAKTFCQIYWLGFNIPANTDFATCRNTLISD